MNEITHNFIGHYREGAACVNEEQRQMYLNIKAIKLLAIEEDMSFDDAYATCVSHELIHVIIYDMLGDNASYKFDNICYRKYTRIKNWIGGIGCK